MSRSIVPALFLLAGCGEEPPALRVGSLGFTGEEARSIPSYSYPELGDVTAWGLAVREGATDSLLAPLDRRAEEHARLRILPYVLGARQLGLAETDLREAYASAPEWELEVQHIIRLVDEAAPAQVRQQAQAEAEEVLRRARAGEDFAALAAEWSEEPGAGERGGLLQPGREGTWVDPFWEAAVALDPGEISGVVESQYGFHVLKLDDRRPVPFDEADRAALLRRVVPVATASAAMEEWVTRAPSVALHPADVEAARQRLVAGTIPLDSAIFSAGETLYTGAELAAAWAAAMPEERNAMSTEGDTFGGWIQQQVQEALWAAEAERLGAPIPGDLAREARTELRGTAARWSAVFGFTPEMAMESVRAAALQGVASSGQEFRIARQELAGLRPILRHFYPLVVPGEVDPS